jgi:hypothetical protein
LTIWSDAVPEKILQSNFSVGATTHCSAEALEMVRAGPSGEVQEKGNFLHELWESLKKKEKGDEIYTKKEGHVWTDVGLK